MSLSKRGWKECRLGDVAEFGNGKARPKTEGLIPVYGGNGILSYCDQFNYNSETIIIGRVGAYCGSVYYENKPVWVSDNALSVKTKSKNNTKFLFYFLKNLNINQLAEGSSHPLITQTLLKSIDVVITDNENEQRAIAGVLSSLDDKIDLLRRQNKTLEGITESLWRKMFVENADIQWQTSKLGNFIKTTSGGTPSRSRLDYYENGTIQWVKSKELQGTFILDTEEKITEEALNNSSAKFLPKHSLLLAMYGATVGEYGILAEQATCNQAVCALLPNENYPYTFIYMFLKINKDEIINRAIGSAQQNISQVVIQNLQVFQPNRSIINFHESVEGLFEKIKVNIFQIRTLSHLRDTLLPRLMNGEMMVG